MIMPSEVKFPPTSAAPVTGSQPEGATSEADASSKVRAMFTKIAPRYDLLNHVLSMHLDRLWRARVTRRLSHILARPDALVLDLCSGTGDLALSLSRHAAARILGADFAHSMLVRAKEKSAQQSRATKKSPVAFLEADALCLPFASESFDAVTAAFGFRNLANYESGLREIHRVLKPRGTIAILEFTEPPDNLLGNVYRWYFTNILPRIGGLLSGGPAAYKYLPKSVSRFLHPADLAALMSKSGYTAVEFRTWTLDTVALHIGEK
jgi:demethylmenaquinone methyltransferase/2-methoxy-6-polyprenyl-1,4-benzoquinol methylase